MLQSFIYRLPYPLQNNLPLIVSALILCLILFPVLLYLLVTFCKNRIKLHIQKKNRQLFQQQYKIKFLPESVMVFRNKTPADLCYYELEYPHWLHQKLDGTRDARYRSNYIIWEQSNLYLNEYTITSLRPYDLLFVVHVLRASGIPIRRTVEERKKFRRMQRERQARSDHASASAIASYYASDPTGFENFCAILFSKMGFSASVTSKTRDGGFDIYLKKDALSGIVECKCYNANHIIGRPALQKLVGANQTERADTMYFVTTSSFSTDAITYANQTGINLINGVALASLVAKYLAPSAETSKSDIKLKNESEFTVEDMRPYVSEDIFMRYFEPHL